MSDQDRLDFLSSRTRHLTEDELQDEKECPLCKQEYNVRESPDASPEIAVEIEPCKHVLGQDCLQRYVFMDEPYHNKCPICRAVLFGSPDPNVSSVPETPVVSGEPSSAGESHVPPSRSTQLADQRPSLWQRPPPGTTYSNMSSNPTSFNESGAASVDVNAAAARILARTEATLRQAREELMALTRRVPERGPRTNLERRGAFDAGDGRLQGPSYLIAGSSTGASIAPMNTNTEYPPQRDSENHVDALHSSNSVGIEEALDNDSTSEVQESFSDLRLSPTRVPSEHDMA